ncbi:MAG: S-ribosylhomocysteine lyase [Ruminococcaceae bacterium]|nr:S-ribosylhomocysteine lyase [Oscillospiraceae bacterium]
MKRIASFSVDHDKIGKGMYISRIDGDITSFDLRTRVPNKGDYMDNVTMHSVEHMLATFLRNGEIGKNVIYFGPMGCRTGFYLLTRDLEPMAVLEALKAALAATVAHEGAVFGATRKECGNYLELDIAAAKKECAAYLAVLQEHKGDFSYANE